MGLASSLIKTPRQNGWLTKKQSDGITGLAMALPACLLILVFAIIPVATTLYLSFFDWSFYQESRFVGIANYQKIIFDPWFWNSIWVGVQFTFWNMTISMVLGFIAALAVRRMGSKMASVTKTLMYLPTIISGIIVSYIFVFIYNFRGGILNTLIGYFGVKPQAWLTKPDMAMFAMVFPSIWLAVGYKALVLLAGMNDIPSQYYEAASLDGAGWVQKLVHITIPCLKNVLFYLAVTGVVTAMQMFDLSRFVTNGGPQGITTMPVLYLYNRFTSDLFLGPSMAGALILALVLGSVSWIVFKTINSDKNIDG